MSGVYLSIDQRHDGALQMSIGDEGGSGYRISGPKYLGTSICLRKHILSERDIDEISAYLRRARRALKKATAG